MSTIRTAPRFIKPDAHLNLHPINSVSILASFCVWTKSLICKDAANRDSTV
jgi:hypothetical protein